MFTQKVNETEIDLTTKMSRYFRHFQSTRKTEIISGLFDLS
jgi:hypothetical protein